MTASNDRAIETLVDRIARETGRPVPRIDPNGPRSDARVLVVLRDPGELGARKTGILSPIENDDATARNMRRLWSANGLEVSTCVFWNAVPWALEGRRKPRASEISRGATYLAALAKLLPQLRVTVAMGSEAKRACREAGLEAISVCHPGPLGLYGGPVAAATERRRVLEAGLRRAAKLAAS
jgi:uracil-DNA glycosylase